MNKQLPFVLGLAIVISLIMASTAGADDAVKKQILKLFPQADTNKDGVIPDAEEKPNIVIILTDDQGYADVSYNPHSPPEVSTPNIDALANSST